MFSDCVEECTMAICATVRGLGPKGGIARLFYGLLENKRDEEAKQDGSIES